MSEDTASQEQDSPLESMEHSGSKGLLSAPQESLVSIPRGRLAPSPTGLLHIGNAWAFLLAWLACRSEHGLLVLRMEDIDPDRSKQEYAEAIIQDLQWLGLDWDEGGNQEGLYAPYTQSQRTALYTEAITRLERAGHVYPCYCTRKELRTLAGAPHVGDAGAAYAGTCRNLTPAARVAHEAAGRRPCLRLRCPNHPIAFVDGLYGAQYTSLTQCGGDFALCRSDGVIAYQLAVVVDDGAMQITQVVRGEDLLISTPRQLLLFDLLGLPRPSYCHIPLLCDEFGERLAKRHNSLTLNALRALGITPQSIVGYLGWKAGLLTQPVPTRPQELIAPFAAGLLQQPVDKLCLESNFLTQLHSLSATT